MGQVWVRYRIDGLLHDIMTFEREQLPSVVSRFKIMVQMEISEWRVPQDGRIRVQMDNSSVDLRISSCPTIHGEKVVVRILDQRRAISESGSLGMEEKERNQFRAMLSRPWGMILVSGPTGNGKSTTLTAGLHDINTRDVNIAPMGDLLCWGGETFMFHRNLSRRHQHLMLATALMAAWMWSLPFLGGLGTLLPGDDSTGLPFTLVFLIGSVCGYLPLAFLRPSSQRSRLAVASPFASLALMLMFYASGYLQPGAGGLLHLALALAMGACIAPLFAAWGASIARVPARYRGRYVGEMLFAASAAHVIILALIRLSAPAGLPAVALMIGISGLLLRTARPSEADIASPAVQSAEGAPSRERIGRAAYLFWPIFFLVLVSYYALSWTGHALIGSAAVEGPVLGLLGPALYGIAALCGGIIVDRTEELETGAMLGLAFLISVHLIAPLVPALELWVPVNLVMEASYGILDLFVFVCIAAAAGMLGQSPYHYYALGLALNAALMTSGLAWMEEIAAANLDLSHSLAMAAALVVGTTSIAVLRVMRGRLQGPEAENEETMPPIDHGFSVEELTPREKDVVELILEGHENTTIAEMLHITVNTLKTHLRNIYGKAQVNSRAQLILKLNGQLERLDREEVSAG